MLLKISIKFSALVLLTLACSHAYGDHYVDRNFVTHDNQDLNYYYFAPAKNKETDTLIIWIAPGFGLNARHFNIAEKVTAKGIEIWMIDFADSLFEPHATSTMREMDARYVRDIIVAAHKKTGKNIIVLAQSYGAIPALKGIREWQLSASKQKPEDKLKNNYLIGSILFSPDLYATIPSLGLAPVYEPAVSATNVPVMIFQGGKRNSRWQVKHVIDELQKGGSQVYLIIQKGVTALFYTGDKAPATKVRLQVVPDEIVKIIKLLKRTPAPLIAAPLIKKQVAKKSLDDKIKPFKGKSQPPQINLVDINGKHYLRKNYAGKATIVNFWASWCPPCVQEIPSLNRLRAKMGSEAFELISINYAEDKQRIKAFMKRVDVDFPVLLDETGETSAKWMVLVLPSTFVIGADGRIQYGVNAAIEWDSEEVIDKLKSLKK